MPAFPGVAAAPSPMPRWSAQDMLIASGLALITFALFAHSAGNGFIMLDDGHYVTSNPPVVEGLKLSSIRWALTSFYAANWHPLTWITHETDCQLFGLSPVGPHLENAGIHALNTALLFSFLTLSTGRRWPSALCAALFGWHPLRVESVAWISERKDVLSLFFFLLTLLAYYRYAQRRTTGGYLLVVAALFLGLTAKPMLVMTPLLLLLLDYWPLGRLTSRRSLQLLVIEKLPLCVLVAASAIVTIVAQHAGGALLKMEGQYTLYSRLHNASTAVVAYVFKLLVPMNLAPFYPFPTQQPAWQFLGAITVLIAITWLCVRTRQDRPYLLVGWIWFIASLVPVIGLVQVGGQSMADRYSYLPCIGFLIAIVWLAADWYERQRSARLLLAVAGAGCALSLIPMTYRQIGFWKDDITLFTHAAAVTKNNWLAESDLGIALADEGNLDDAEIHVRKSLNIRPRLAAGLYMAARLQWLRDTRLPGEEDYSLALKADPSDPKPHYNWANLLLRHGRAEDAAIHYRLYLQVMPDDALAHNNLGVALASLDDLAGAEREFTKAVDLNPNYADALCGLGTVQLRQTRFAEAAANFEHALQLDPRMQRAQAGVAQCLPKL